MRLIAPARFAWWMKPAAMRRGGEPRARRLYRAGEKR